MSDDTGPVPQRIGDAERDRAAALLRDHLTEGRLDQLEFDERLTQALSARTQADLDPLFRDLPGPRPDQALQPIQPSTPPATPVGAAAPAQQSPRDLKWLWAIMSAIAWPAALIICFATDWQYWWIIMLPLFIPWWHNRDKKGH